ncbi:mannose-6-phosphate isomerase, class I [Planococcus sp. APC 4015]|nr:mannose-6-phosphate isomerase, class I [Planococcus sp. APC 4015]
MLITLSNTPRDYAWGSTSLLAGLEGRADAEVPEAEIWFGDHPGDPALTGDGDTLDVWLSRRGAPALPYLLKLLAAGSPLSIQVHPSIAQAQAGFAREEGAGIDRDDPARTYRDANHKPELLVALTDGFRALAGVRPLAQTRRLLATIGDAAAGLAGRLDGSPDATASAIAWVLSESASVDVRAIIGAARAADSEEFADELTLAGRLDDLYPADPGIVVALLMNLVTLRRGEGLFVPAGVLHAYLEGLGVELMAASDNVLRGGLTPKHIDTGELVSVLDAREGAAPIVRPVDDAPGVGRYVVPVPDFGLRVIRAGGDPVDVPLEGVAIALATAGSVTVEAGSTGRHETLAPGQAVLVTADEGRLRVSGDGELFIAAPGR